MAENASAVVSSVRLRPAVLSRIYSKRVSFFRFVVLFLCCGFTFRVGYLFGVNDSGSLAPRTNSPEAIAQPETVTYDNETSAVSTVDLHEQPAIPTVLVVSTQRPTHAPSPPPPCKCSVALTAEGGGIVYFVEVLAALGDGLKELGVDVISTTIPECLQPGSPSDKSCSGRKIITVMFCPYASRKDKPRLPSDTIVYHLEPPTPDHWCSVDDVFNPMKEYAVVWTYTDHFAKILGSKLGGKSVSYLPLGYVPSLELKVDPLPVETCDVAFYGAGNDHRNGILQHLTARGVKVCWQNGWGAERDNVMLTSKIMLNIHFYQKNFEIVRMFYYLINKRLVISEVIENKEVQKEWEPAIVFADSDPEAFYKTVKSYLDNEAERKKKALEGYNFIRARPQKDIMRQHLPEVCPPCFRETSS